jgi:hypothetical protein
MHPNKESTPHSHPFQSLTVHISGRLRGRREGITGEWLTDQNWGHIGETIEPNQWHAFSTGPTGAVMYVISRWDDPREMNSATIKYLGEPLGDLHKQTLEKIQEATT